MPPNPYYEAQAQAAEDPSQGPAAAPMATGSMAGGGGNNPPPESPKFHDGSLGAIGTMRDALMAQFPEINNIGDEPLNYTGAEKLGLLAVAIQNPQGALDLVRQRRNQHLAKRKMAAEMNIKMLGVAGDVVKTQNALEQQMFQSRMAVAEFKQNEEKQRFQEELGRGSMELQKVTKQVQEEQLQRGRGQDAMMERFMPGGGASGEPTPAYDPATGMPQGNSVPSATAGGAKPGGGYGRPTITSGPGGTSMQFASPDVAKSDPVMTAFNNYFATRQSKSRDQLDVATVWKEFQGLMAARQGGMANLGNGFPPTAGFNPPAPVEDDPNLGE